MWNEKDHPRDKDGTFCSKEGSAKSGSIIPGKGVPPDDGNGFGAHSGSSPDESKKPSADAYIEAFGKYIFERLCDSYGVDASAENAKEKLQSALTKGSQHLSKKRSLFRTSQKQRIWVDSDHYSRLKTMWSDYHRGACRLARSGSSLYFNIDKTIYKVIGKYPNFTVVGKKFYKNHYCLEKAYRSLYGKRKKQFNTR